MEDKHIEGVDGYNPPDLVQSHSPHHAQTVKINENPKLGKENLLRRRLPVSGSRSYES